MSRAEIANYLSLTRETVCRMLAELGRLGLIELHRRSLRVADPVGLAEISGEAIEVRSIPS